MRDPRVAWACVLLVVLCTCSAHALAVKGVEYGTRPQGPLEVLYSTSYSQLSTPNELEEPLEPAHVSDVVRVDGVSSTVSEQTWLPLQQYEEPSEVALDKIGPDDLEFVEIGASTESGVTFSFQKGMIKYKSNPTLCVDTRTTRATNGMWLYLGVCGNSSPTQLFESTNCGQIRWVGHNVCFDDFAGGRGNGVRTVLWSCNCFNGNQKFYFDEGSNSVRWRTGGTCFDVPGNRAVAGQSLWQWQCNSSPAQMWIVETYKPKAPPNPQCSTSLGVKYGGVGALPTKNFRASSMWNSGHAPHQGRLFFPGTCWCARWNDHNQWLEVDLGQKKTIAGISTQGRQNMDQYVTQYRVKHSLDRAYYKDYSGGAILTGNFDRNTVVTNWMKPRFQARFVRLCPFGWKNHISMRMDVLGCMAKLGPRGPPGDPGVEGPKGLQGVPGPIGDKGPTGELGFKGPNGEEGNEGLQGEVGKRGPRGAKGPRGVDGLDAEPGVVGDPGSRGKAGEAGGPGQNGIPGPMGPEGAEGKEGAAGAKGEQGIPGETGGPGKKGKKGDNGKPGLLGAKGDTGPGGTNGMKGEEGEYGLKGLPGPQGLPGYNGKQGEKGEPGEDGGVENRKRLNVVESEVDDLKLRLEDTLDQLKIKGYNAGLPGGGAGQASLLQAGAQLQPPMFQTSLLQQPVQATQPFQTFQSPYPSLLQPAAPMMMPRFSEVSSSTSSEVQTVKDLFPESSSAAELDELAELADNSSGPMPELPLPRDPESERENARQRREYEALYDPLYDANVFPAY